MLVRYAADATSSDDQTMPWMSTSARPGSPWITAYAGEAGQSEARRHKGATAAESVGKRARKRTGPRRGEREEAQEEPRGQRAPPRSCRWNGAVGIS